MFRGSELKCSILMDMEIAMVPDEVLLELKRTGNRKLAQRDYQSAAECFERLIREVPDAREGYIGLAKTLERRGRVSEVISLLQPVVDKIESDQIVRLLADAYRALAFRGDSTKVDCALKYYERYHRNRLDPVTLQYQGDLYREKRDYGAALRSYRAAWDLEPRNRKAYMSVLNCLRQLRRPDEIELMKSLWKERNRK
jgi:tetratricopeptide (TPR) repeat protein